MLDELWQQLKSEAEAVTKEEPLLASYVYACVLNHESLQSALSFILANKLSDDVMPVATVRELFAYCPDSSHVVVHHMEKEA